MLSAAFAPVDLLPPALTIGLTPSQQLFQVPRRFHSALKPARILKPPTGHPIEMSCLFPLTPPPDLG
jgi:hypothetical protein